MGTHVTPFMISPPAFVNKALQLLKIGSQDVFLDIGCGDGAILEAAAAFKPKALLGIELLEHLCEKSRRRVPHAEIFAGHWETFPHVLRRANKVYLFLDMGGVSSCAPILNAHLPRDAKIISCDFPLLEQEHSATYPRIKNLGKRAIVGDMDLFMYTME
eukprot:GEMP01054232.1.p1 GENE.GEMP01054232.1~~GEMP01054232.1.p1  ORF type:complete len:159 (+),score=34.45 GEMP01054232.1:252-728(+)